MFSERDACMPFSNVLNSGVRRESVGQQRAVCARMCGFTKYIDFYEAAAGSCCLLVYHFSLLFSKNYVVLPFLPHPSHRFIARVNAKAETKFKT